MRKMRDPEVLLFQNSGKSGRTNTEDWKGSARMGKGNAGKGGRPKAREECSWKEAMLNSCPFQDKQLRWQVTPVWVRSERIEEVCCGWKRTEAHGKAARQMRLQGLSFKWNQQAGSPAPPALWLCQMGEIKEVHKGICRTAIWIGAARTG